MSIFSTKELKIPQHKIDAYIKFAEVVMWGRRNPVQFISRFLGIDLLDYQKFVLMKSWTTPFCLWVMSRSAGKALALDTKIPTPKGFVKMGDLRIGDYVFGVDGTPTKINYVSEIFLGNECYEVEFDDGAKIIADENHLWDVQTANDRRTISTRIKRKYQGLRDKINLDEYGYRTLDTKTMSINYYPIVKSDGSREYTYQLPINNPVIYSEKQLLLKPYTLGLWLGDGHSASARMTCSDGDIDEICSLIANDGYNTKKYKNKNRAPYIGIGTSPRGQENNFKTGLKLLKLINNKHIPGIYLLSSLEQRLELLRGLMDSDGCCDQRGRCEFSQKSYEFILQFSQLLSSLGIKHKMQKRETSCGNKKFESYRIGFSLDKSMPCFKLKRKKERQINLSQTKHTFNRKIISIKRVKSVPTKCISVDHKRGLFLCGEKFIPTHNTTLAAPFIMAKSLLIPNFQTYILAGVGSQSKEVFMKIEKIAKREISSFTGITDIFENELIKSTANQDGFTHDPNGFKYHLFNGAVCHTLNGNPDSNRGPRSNLNFYDESGFTPEDVFTNSKPFIAQNADFKLGGGIDSNLFPKSFPNQIIMASSASGEDTYFWKQYKEYGKRMIMGDKDYFVADIDCDVVINATYNGKIISPPLLTRKVVDEEMQQNRPKAMREYKNIFDTDGGDAQIIKRASIIRNSTLRPPTLYNTGGRKFIFSYDPARSHDNSVLLVGELVFDKNIGYRLELCNCMSFADINKKKKTPMRYPDQRKMIKQFLLDYNGELAADYENIEIFLIDAGAGGGGVQISDEFMEEWTDSKGNFHKGLLDYIHLQTKDYISRFPRAVDKIRLLEPRKQRKEMFEALIECVSHDLISFTETYDGRGKLVFDDLKESGKKDELGKNTYDFKEKIYKLSPDEEMSLIQMDLLKEEIVNIYRYENKEKGSVSYGLAKAKVNLLCDDRAYAISMMAWYLQQIRHKAMTQKPTEPINVKSAFKARKPDVYGRNKSTRRW